MRRSDRGLGKVHRHLRGRNNYLKDNTDNKLLLTLEILALCLLFRKDNIL